MNIAIIGAGNVGGALGVRWAQNGHRVIFGARDPQSEKVRKVLAKAGPNARAAGVAEAVAESEAALLATPWSAAQSAIEAAGDWSGKILIDAVNPVKPDLTGLALGTDDSAGERIAAWAKGARVVKAFSTTGSDNMLNPRYGDTALDMYIAGDDAAARGQVAELAAELGFEPVVFETLTAARHLEPLAMAWIHLAFAGGYGRDFGFKIIKR